MQSALLSDEPCDHRPSLCKKLHKLCFSDYEAGSCLSWHDVIAVAQAILKRMNLLVDRPASGGQDKGERVHSHNTTELYKLSHRSGDACKLSMSEIVCRLAPDTAGPLAHSCIEKLITLTSTDT